MLCGYFPVLLKQTLCFLVGFFPPRLEEEICSMFLHAPTVVCMQDPRLWKYRTGSPSWWYCAVWWCRWWVATCMHIILYLCSCSTAWQWGTSIHSVHYFFGQNTETAEDGKRNSFHQPLWCSPHTGKQCQVLVSIMNSCTIHRHFRHIGKTILECDYWLHHICPSAWDNLAPTRHTVVTQYFVGCLLMKSFWKI